MTLQPAGPIRTCIGCRTRRPLGELRRLSLDSQMRLKLDAKGFGRGAWLCAHESSQCLSTALKARALMRALRAEPDQTSIDLVVASLAAATDPQVKGESAR